MRWRKLLVSGGAVLGAAATYNALAAQHVSPVDNALGGDERWFEWRGYRIAYTVRGSGAPVLLVHGIHAAASDFEWRNNAAVLSRQFTVYSIDLIGFGRSERPAARYSGRLFTALIDDFVAQVVSAPCALIASGLSAAYAIVLGARDPGRFPALVVIGPTGLIRLNLSATTRGDFARVAVDTPVVGTAMYNALVSRRSLRTFLQSAYADNALVSDDMVEQYYCTSHQPGAKHAPGAFVAGQLNIDVRHALRRLGQHALLVWGEQAEIAPVEEARGFLALKPDLELAILDPAGDLPHDERPDEFNEVVLEFLARTQRTIAAA